MRYFIIFEPRSLIYLFLRSKTIDSRKNAAEYQIKCSAVKKTHKANKGIDKNRHANPAIVAKILFRFIEITRNTRIKIMS